MIEKMKQVGVLSSAPNKSRMLDELKELGVLHIAEKSAPDASVSDYFSSLTRMQMVLSEYPEASGKGVKDGKSADKAGDAGSAKCSSETSGTKGSKGAKSDSGITRAAVGLLSDEEFSVLHKNAESAYLKKKKLSNELSGLNMLQDSVAPWGDFIPSDLVELKNKGIELHFYRVGKAEYGRLSESEDIKFISLKPVDKMQTVAVIGSALDKSWPCIEFRPPEMGLGQIQGKISSIKAEISNCDEVLKNAAGYVSSYKAQIVKARNALSYSSVSNTIKDDSGIIYIEGYIPDADISAFKETAQRNAWAYAICEVDKDDEAVPTKVRYNKVTGLMKPVFSILGTVPGYREYDISFWFLCFFSLFFAMIIGDAGYGVLFLLLAVALNVKTCKFSDTVLLLYVLSICNIIWGALTGTWFGLEGAMKIPFFKGMVVPAIANYPEYFGVGQIAAQNNVMKFCFIIGTVQLSLACVLNVKTKVPKKDLSFVADIGWLLSINALYYIVLLLVLGEKVKVGLCFVFVIAGFLLVVLFGGMSPDVSFSKGLKTGLGGAFTTFLNTISAFGNVMSYIRLFAVGMASLAIAQSFNNMAGGFNGILKIAGIIIFVIGHALNLVMGLLSVVVHGVRLNLLEFSGQLGMEWSGIAYEPFAKIEK